MVIVIILCSLFISPLSVLADDNLAKQRAVNQALEENSKLNVYCDACSMPAPNVVAPTQATASPVKSVVSSKEEPFTIKIPVSVQALDKWIKKHMW